MMVYHPDHLSQQRPAAAELPLRGVAVELLPKMPTRSQPDLEPATGFGFADCDRLIGDEPDRVVTWKGNSDISTIGETISVRVTMFQAKLFAYKV